MRDLVRIDDLNREEMERIFRLAEDMEVLRMMGSDLCKGRILATIFYEPSTRTRLSFESAMLRLGGEVLGFADPQATSFVKEETLADTIHMVCNYADLIVIRHRWAGAAALAAHHSSVPIVNAGDDSHQHPTQTLTDLYTLRKRGRRIEELTVGIVGDLRYGRAAHSLAYGLAAYGARMIFIAPEGLEMPEEVCWRLQAEYRARFETVREPKEALPELDVIYMNRLQKERLPQDLDVSEVRRILAAYRLDPEMMKHARPDCLVMHPLPRVEEIARELDADPRAIYFEQSANGVPVRMALMAILLNRVDQPPLRGKVRTVRHLEEHVCQNPVCVTQQEPNNVPPQIEEPVDGRPMCAYCSQWVTV
ncbi:MAG: aspartate carbamoyltransferase [Candidatus Poribacteria bacterium]|nr:MAG: aspartate carbamoyltransferase [Candidatus Poribacteria bacterium]